MWCNVETCWFDELLLILSWQISIREREPCLSDFVMKKFNIGLCYRPISFKERWLRFQTLHFDTSLNYHDYHSRSQLYETNRTCSSFFSQITVLLWMKSVLCIFEKRFRCWISWCKFSRFYQTAQYLGFIGNKIFSRFYQTAQYSGFIRNKIFIRFCQTAQYLGFIGNKIISRFYQTAQCLGFIGNKIFSRFYQTAHYLGFIWNRIFSRFCQTTQYFFFFLSTWIAYGSMCSCFCPASQLLSFCSYACLALQ